MENSAHRDLMGHSKIVLASHNQGKIREITELLLPFGLTVLSANDVDLPEPDETELTFAGNARLKARASCEATGLPALSDDSGLDVTALDGRPGIYAARWAELPKVEGGGRDFDMAMWHVNNELGNAADRSARFICALCLAMPGGTERVYEGKVEGQITWPPRGDKGFGYDPIFVAHGDRKTFAEIDPGAKHAKSHRADAFVKFLADQFPKDG
jgi:XTP/dITP diphosphohydrolase